MQIEQLLFEQTLIQSAFIAIDITNSYSVDALHEHYGELAPKRFSGNFYGLMLQQNLANVFSQYYPEYREEDRSSVIEPDIVHMYDSSKSIEVKTTCGQYHKKTDSWTFNHSYKKPAQTKDVCENYILLTVYDPIRYPIKELRGTFREIAMATYGHHLFVDSNSKRNESYIKAADRDKNKNVLCRNCVTINDTSAKPLTIQRALHSHRIGI